MVVNLISRPPRGGVRRSSEVILADTSVWIDHLRRTDLALVRALEVSSVAMHPHILGELALGSLRDRGTLLGLLRALPAASCATDTEV